MKNISPLLSGCLYFWCHIYFWGILREFGMKGDKGLLWEGCKTCFFPPTKFCLIIMMHDQLWFNSYMWRKEQDTQTNQQTHTHTHHHLCMKCACYLKVSKIFIHLGKMLYYCWNIYPGKSCNCDQSYYLIYDRSAIIRKFMRNQNLIIADCRLDLWSM